MRTRWRGWDLSPLRLAGRLSVEMDRTWTVYKVFTGISTHADQGAMTDPNHAAATGKMLFLNRRSQLRHGACCRGVRRRC